VSGGCGGRQFENLADDFLLNHHQRLIEAVCLPKESSMYLAMVDYRKGIESHTRQIGQKLSGHRSKPQT
jgi:hypothetical protein